MNAGIEASTIAFASWFLFLNFCVGSELRQVEGASELSYLKTPVQFYCENPAEDVKNPSYEDRTKGRDRADPINPSPFYRAKILSINFDIIDETCGNPCRTAISQTLITSFALWRSGCGQCGDDKLVAISVNGQVWMDNVTMDKWIYSQKIDSRFVRLQDPNAQQRIGLRPLQPIIDYKLVRPSGSSELCLSAEKYAASKDLVRAVCSSDAPACISPGCLPITVRIGGSQSCSLVGRIACGAADLEIALNTVDYAFEYKINDLTGGLKVTLGRGQEKLDLLRVVLHEVGHWFGLPHTEEPNVVPASIMRDVHHKNVAQCITGWNLIQLDNAASQSWEFRMNGSHGLIYGGTDP